MSEQTLPHTSQYYRMLKGIIDAATTVAYLWDNMPEGMLSLFSGWTCEQDNEYDTYGLVRDKKGRLYFGSKPNKKKEITRESVMDMIEAARQYKVPLKDLKSQFLEHIENPIREEAILNAGISLKVERAKKTLATIIDSKQL